VLQTHFFARLKNLKTWCQLVLPELACRRSEVHFLKTERLRYVHRVISLEKRAPRFRLRYVSVWRLKTKYDSVNYFLFSQYKPYCTDIHYRVVILQVRVLEILNLLNEFPLSACEYVDKSFWDAKPKGVIHIGTRCYFISYV
jgi:hypothetical protein